MSLLNISHCPFPRVLSSPNPPPSRPSASSTSMARSCRNSPSASARRSGSGRMADPAPNTGYEPKLSNNFSYMDTVHTPIHFFDSHHDFQNQDGATVISTIDPEGFPHSGASSSSKQTAASRVPSTFGPPSLWKQMADHVSSRPGLQENGTISDRESVATTIFSSQSKGKRDRDTNVVHSLKDRDNLHKILERKVDSAVRGEMMAQRKLYEAEAEVEARNCEKRNSDIAFHVINQEFESAVLCQAMYQSIKEEEWIEMH